MINPSIFRLPPSSVCVCKVVGSDSVKILNNLTTQAIAELSDGEACESFVTNVRGKTLGHGFVFRESAECLWFLGSANPDPNADTGARQSTRLDQQVEKYTIREDAAVEICDGKYSVYVVPPEAKEVFPDAFGNAWVGAPVHAAAWSGLTSWCGPDTGVLVVATEEASHFESVLSDGIEWNIAGEDGFQKRRIAEGFPWYHLDLDEKNLPQEMGRDDEAISFTKGCYLGQEIVAIMDARRQVQRLWLGGRVTEGKVGRGDLLIADEDSEGKASPVVRVTSASDDFFRGFVRRSHFDAGSRAKLVSEAGEILARVEITADE
ncbi:MAG: hypothetical protein AAF664_04385 [Planctomycetota bacterium]